ncbi:MAG: hypothetical protein AAFY99_13220 [Pseudomonadota bacterium]
MKEFPLAILAVAAAALGIYAGQLSPAPSADAAPEKAKKSAGGAYTLSVPIAIAVVDKNAVDGYLFFRYSVTGLNKFPVETLARSLPAVSNNVLFEEAAKAEFPMRQSGYLDIVAAHELALRNAFPSKLDDVRILQVEYFPASTGRTGLDFEIDG